MSKVHSIMLYQFHSLFKSKIAERMTAVKRSDSAGVVIKVRIKDQIESYRKAYYR